MESQVGKKMEHFTENLFYVVVDGDSCQYCGSRFLYKCGMGLTVKVRFS